MFFRVLFSLLTLFPFLLTAKESIALHMIVKNNKESIVRSLSSVKPFIDYWMIVDLGSTDGTRELVAETLKGIPGELLLREGEKNGSLCQESLLLADAKGDYLLLLEPDEWLEAGSDFKFPSPLQSDGYFFQANEGDSKQLKLIKSTTAFRYPTSALPTLVCDKIPCLSEKIEGIRCLKQGRESIADLSQKVKDNPNDGSLVFLLAKNYLLLGEKELALQFFQNRIEMKGAEEELYECFLAVGYLQQEKNGIDAAIENFHSAHRLFPSRLEPIYCLALLFNQKGQSQLAYEIIQSKDFIARQPSDELKEKWLEKVGLPVQLLFSLRGLGKTAEAQTLLSSLLIDKNFQGPWRERVKALSIERDQELNGGEPLLNGNVPEDSHALFLSAQERLAKGDRRGALKLFTARSEKGGDDEEHFYSLLQIAKIHEELDDLPETIIESYKKATEFNPQHRQAYLYYSKYVGKMERYQEAYEIAKRGMQIELPHETRFESWVDDYGLLWELGFAAMRAGKYEESENTLIKVLEGKKLSPQHQQSVLFFLAQTKRDLLMDKLFRENLGVPPWEQPIKRELKPLTEWKEKVHPNTGKLHLLTFSSYLCKGLDQLLDSCRVHHLSIDVVGLSQSYYGFGQKLKAMREYLSHLPEEDVFLFVDAFDTLMLADEKTVLEKFYLMKSPLVVCAEKYCYPCPFLSSFHPKSPTCFRYLNSGMIIGYAGYLKKILDEMSFVTDECDDQGMLIYYFAYYPDALQLDTHAALFLNTNYQTTNDIELDLENNRVRSLLTGNYPCVLHGPGPNRAVYQYVYDTVFKPIVRMKHKY